jgi:hypothetical protein
MKRIILLAALAASFNVNAVTFEADNTIGGKIVLTDKPSPECRSPGRIAYSTSTTGESLFGCWNMVDERFFVKYTNGTIRIYEMDGFSVKGGANLRQSKGM